MSSISELFEVAKGISEANQRNAKPRPYGAGDAALDLVTNLQQGAVNAKMAEQARLNKIVQLLAIQEKINQMKQEEARRVQFEYQMRGEAADTLSDGIKNSTGAGKFQAALMDIVKPETKEGKMLKSMLGDNYVPFDVDPKLDAKASWDKSGINLEYDTPKPAKPAVPRAGGGRSSVTDDRNAQKALGIVQKGTYYRGAGANARKVMIRNKEDAIAAVRSIGVNPYDYEEIVDEIESYPTREEYESEIVPKSKVDGMSGAWMGVQNKLGITSQSPSDVEIAKEEKAINEYRKSKKGGANIPKPNTPSHKGKKDAETRLNELIDSGYSEDEAYKQLKIEGY